MNAIENEALDLARSIREILARGRERSEERVRKAQAEARIHFVKLQNSQHENYRLENLGE